MQDKYMYKRAAEENCAQVKKLETQLVVVQNQSKKLKQYCVELQKSKKEVALALANAATRIEGLIGGCAEKK
jgi:citrate lyase synthetase